jgi:hypothetical protein
MFQLNNKQREEFAKSLKKVAEYILLVLVISQLALGKFDLLVSLPALCTAMIIYVFSLIILRGYREVS